MIAGLWCAVLAALAYLYLETVTDLAWRETLTRLVRALIIFSVFLMAAGWLIGALS